jgi:hypothetical protein
MTSNMNRLLVALDAGRPLIRVRGGPCQDQSQGEVRQGIAGSPVNPARITLSVTLRHCNLQQRFQNERSRPACADKRQCRDRQLDALAIADSPPITTPRVAPADGPLLAFVQA